nr:MAG TPA: hypothetical protein [Caudoviricetes sp.]
MFGQTNWRYYLSLGLHLYAVLFVLIVVGFSF